MTGTSTAATSAAPCRVAIAGASGRMGRMLIEAVQASGDCVLAGALDIATSAALGTDASAFLGHASGVLITSDLRVGLQGADVLIVIAGFPALFISVFFGGNLIIENIFSLDGLGQLGFRSAVERDYPVIFGTLFAFGLIGLVVGILSDLMYVWVDPRIDFERRG